MDKSTATENKPKLHVLVISDGILGHVSQARGLCQWLAPHFQIEKLEIQIQLRIRSVARIVLSYLLNCNVATDSLLRIFYEPMKLPQQNFDLIISAGGNTSFANIILARHYHAKNIFIGSKRRLDAKLFTAHLTLEPNEGNQKASNNNVILNLTPTTITQENILAAATSLTPKYTHSSNKALWAFLCGGDGAGFMYSNNDWEELANWLNKTAQKNNIQWLITTSRRTPPEAEKILEENLKPDILAYGAWWHQKEEKVIQGFLGSAMSICVTADSMTMVNESITSGKPTYVLFMNDTKPNARYLNALKKLEHLGGCKLTTTTERLITSTFVPTLVDNLKGPQVQQLVGMITPAK